MELGQLTLRGYDRCLRVAWTISDLDGADRPGFRQVEEARGLRAGGAAA
jgi:magnesium chelatase family protein